MLVLLRAACADQRNSTRVGARASARAAAAPGVRVVQAFATLSLKRRTKKKHSAQ